MDVKTLRRLNLGEIEDDLGSLAEIERRTAGEVTASYLSQVKNGYRDLGDRVARKIEMQLGYEHGWMDQNHPTDRGPKVSQPRYRAITPHGGALQVRQIVTELTNETVTPAIYSVPVLEIEASMGVGAIEPQFETIIGKIDLNQQYITKHLPTASSPSNIRVITGRGDSMWDPQAGGFQDGDPLFVDVGIHDVKIAGVYVFAHNEELYVKRLMQMPGGSLTVISDNVKYPSYQIDPRKEDVRIIGRVLHAWNGRKLA